MDIALAALLIIFCVFLAVRQPAWALICGLAAAAVCVYLAVEYENVFVAAVAIIVFPITLFVVMFAHFRDRPRPMVYTIAKRLLIFLPVCCCITGAVKFLPASLYLLLLVPILIVAIIQCKGAQRYSILLEVIDTIGTAIRQNMPLSMALNTAAGQRQDKAANLLRITSEWLSQGYHLSDALKLAYPKCPADVVAAVAAGEKTNQLPETIKSLQMRLSEKARNSDKPRPLDLTYPFVVLVIAFGILIGIMIFAMPVMHEVFDEMSQGTLSLPASTQLLMDFTHFLLSDGCTPLLIILITLLTFIAFSAYVRYRPRRPEKPHLLSRIADFLRWHIPLLHWFEYNLSLLSCIGVIRTSLNSGCTVDQAVEQAAELDLNHCFKQRLKHWLKEIRHGENISAAAKKARIGKNLAWAFDQELNQANTPNVLKMLEEFYLANYHYKLNLTGYIVSPLIVLGLGLIIGFVVFAMYMPMVTITSYRYSRTTLQAVCVPCAATRTTPSAPGILMATRSAVPS